VTTKGVLPSTEIQDMFYVVLVEPQQSLNVGSVARAMGNLGFKHLRLVAPRNYSHEKAIITACWAEPILQNAQHFDSLDQALADMNEVVGFSARHGETQDPPELLPEWVGRLRREELHKTALVFGPEDTGLRTEHLDLCRRLVRIPSSSTNPAFNLSQAALIALYELSRLNWDEVSLGKTKTPAEWSQFSQLDVLVEQVLNRVGFYREGNTTNIASSIKSLFRRTEPDKREIQILLGIFGRIQKALTGRVPLSPEREEV